MQINSNIFREYDIRGVAGVKFDPKVVEEYGKWYGAFPGITINLDTSKAIGKAYASIIRRNGGKNVVVGYEVRPYADELKASFVSGILEMGIDVIEIGKSTTPLVYFLTSFGNYGGGVNITGSHNVYFYNGFKVMKQGTSPIYGEELQEMLHMIENDDYQIPGEITPGQITNLDTAYETYKKYILEHFHLSRPLNIVIDCGNGTPGLFSHDLFTSLGCNIVEELYFTPDAYFPNHVPDPESPENMRDLMAAVKKNNADLGIAFDADGDRVGFVNNNGEYIFGDEILLLLSKDVLSRNPGKTILFDVKSTSLLPELIPTFSGGVPLMHRTGHAPIKDSMRKNLDIILGGEVSGHFYFAENYFRIDDGFWAACTILRILSESNESISSLLSFIPKKVRTPEIKLPCEDNVKFKVIEQVIAEFIGKYDITNIDGARINFDKESWGLVRASNTSPYLTIRVEAMTAERVIEIKNILADVLDKYSEIKDKLDRHNVVSLTGRLGYL